VSRCLQLLNDSSTLWSHDCSLELRFRVGHKNNNYILDFLIVKVVDGLFRTERVVTRCLSLNTREQNVQDIPVSVFTTYL